GLLAGLLLVQGLGSHPLEHALPLTSFWALRFLGLGLDGNDDSYFSFVCSASGKFGGDLRHVSSQELLMHLGKLARDYYSAIGAECGFEIVKHVGDAVRSLIEDERLSKARKTLEH